MPRQIVQLLAAAGQHDADLKPLGDEGGVDDYGVRRGGVRLAIVHRARVNVAESRWESGGRIEGQVNRSLATIVGDLQLGAGRHRRLAKLDDGQRLAVPDEVQFSLQPSIPAGHGQVLEHMRLRELERRGGLGDRDQYRHGCGEEEEGGRRSPSTAGH